MSLQSGLTIVFKSGAITGLLAAGLSISYNDLLYHLINLDVDTEK